MKFIYFYLPYAVSVLILCSFKFYDAALYRMEIVSKEQSSDEQTEKTLQMANEKNKRQTTTKNLE